MDQLRQAVGDAKLSYLGFSYGTFLGATYESMFPNKVRAAVLDGAVDAEQYINKPMAGVRAQSAGLDRGFNRFFQGCAANQTACLGFGGDDPRQAFDKLYEQSNAHPIPADPSQSSGEPVTGDDLLTAFGYDIYAKRYRYEIAQMLAAAQAGDGTLARQLVDAYFGVQDDGSFDPGTDRYFALSALEQKYPTSPSTYFDAGEESWRTFDYAWWNTGYVELNFGLLDTIPVGRFSGPFEAPADAPATLVVATTYDPATPYRASRALVRELGNARLLTMWGDGHTAYGGNSPCIDEKVDAYLFDLAVPAFGTSCQQEVPFEQPQPQPQAQAKTLATAGAATVRPTAEGLRVAQ